MSYNWKCCSFYPNNFDASALKELIKSSYPERSTCVPRPRDMCTPTEGYAYPDRGTMTLRYVFTFKNSFTSLKNN